MVIFGSRQNKAIDPESVISEIAVKFGVRLNSDKLEFLRNIAKTKYSGLTISALIISFKVLEDKDESWFKDLVEDGLAEIYTFQGNSGKNSWDGWFITNKGRQVIREYIKRNNDIKKTGYYA